jgi:hypothetical protein
MGARARGLGRFAAWLAQHPTYGLKALANRVPAVSYVAVCADLANWAWTTSTAVDDAIPSGLQFIPNPARRSTLT